jgi:excisionase family DNA binding protein
MPKLMTVQEVAEYLGVSVNRVYDLAAARIIPFVKVGRLLRFDPDRLAEWVRNGGSPIR